MLNLRQIPAGLCGLLLFVAAAGPATPRAEATEFDELYAAPSFDETRSHTIAWVAARGIDDEDLLEQIGAVWAVGDEEPPARALFEKVIETFGLADPETKQFVEACGLLNAPLVPPRPAMLTEEDAPEHYAANLRLFYARYLTQRKMYDEALEVFGRLDPKQVVDPATCLFFQAVCEHQLLMKDEGLATLTKLLQNTENVPSGYATVAKLMQHDLEGLRDKTIDQIARQMRDSERRLELARGGPRVQKVQGEIIAGLDELIEKLEEQSGGGGGGGGGGNSNQPGSPADDSRVKGQTAPGDVDPKELSRQGGWGDLPPREQARAKNLIGREFPSHYRQAIEEYFKKLAGRRAEPER